MNLLQNLKFPHTFGVFTVIHMHSFLDHLTLPQAARQESVDPSWCETHWSKQ